MFKKTILSLFVVTILCAVYLPATMATETTELTYLTEEYPPFNFEENGKLKGIAVELLNEVWAKMGIPAQKIQLLPWARAYKMVQMESNTVLFSTTRSIEREDLFKWVGPIKSNPIGFIARKDSKIKINSIDDAKKYTLGTVREDYCETVLKSKGFDITKLDRTAKLTTNIKKLKNKRIDIVVNSVEGTFLDMKQNGFNTDDYESVGILSDVALYYAFHKDTPDEIIVKFQNALNSLEDKRITILKKYGK